MKFTDCLNPKRPPLVAMITNTSIDDAISEITSAIYDGADAIGISLCHLEKKYRDAESYDKLFAACIGKPVYVYCYPAIECAGLSYEECMEILIFAAERCKAYSPVICDIMCDTFDKGAKEGFSYDPIAAEKQMAVTERIHGIGAQVLYSVHHKEFLGEEEIVRQARIQVERGADLVKIVTQARTREELMANLEIINKLKIELDRPVLYLSGGRYSHQIRQVGPAFGSCMYLVVDNYNAYATKMQPSLRSTKAIRDSLIIVD